MITAVAYNLEICVNGIWYAMNEEYRKSIDDLDDYPPITSLFKDHTARELDTFLTFMEAVISSPDAPGICKDDAASVHGDAVIAYADMVGPEGV